MKHTPIPNTSFKYKKSSITFNKCGSGQSIIENYLSSGLIPRSFTTMNSFGNELSTAQQGKKFERPQNVKVRLENEPREYYEFEKNINGTNITTKIKILRIKNLKADCSIIEFERLAKSNE